MFKVWDREVLAIKQISVINEKQKRREQLTVGHLVLTDISTIQIPHLSLRDISEEEAQRLSENQEVFCETVSPINDRRAAPMMLQQYGFPNKTSTMTTQIDVM